MEHKNPEVDFYFNKGPWQQELKQLRNIVLGCGLAEELKWGVPCYTLQQANVVLIHVFKEYCALLFVKGALLQDAEGILIRQSKQVQAARQARFSSVADIVPLSATLKAYIYEAITVEEAGLKVALKQTSDYEVAEEFQQQLDTHPKLRTAFESLTPGRQRAYLLHFAQPKQSTTRASRVEKCSALILAGKGLND